MTSERAFKDFGLPMAIRTDNGVPFSCANALFGLSRLSVWWLRLGIEGQLDQHPPRPRAPPTSGYAPVH